MFDTTSKSSVDWWSVFLGMGLGFNVSFPLANFHVGLMGACFGCYAIASVIRLARANAN